jgi:hypothetical protein
MLLSPAGPGANRQYALRGSRLVNFLRSAHRGRIFDLTSAAEVSVHFHASARSCPVESRLHRQDGLEAGGIGWAAVAIVAGRAEVDGRVIRHRANMPRSRDLNSPAGNHAADRVTATGPSDGAALDEAAMVVARAPSSRAAVAEERQAVEEFLARLLCP